MDGRKVVSTFTRGQGASLVEDQSEVDGPTTILMRTFTREGMEVAMTINGVNASSVFLRS